LAVIVAIVPIIAFPFARTRRWLDPYTYRSVRWMIYIGGGVAFALFVLALRGGC
jgi:multisubunit Na+/H+ antiporter MnhB subunit